jgi:hypothetical protein
MSSLTNSKAIPPLQEAWQESAPPRQKTIQRTAGKIRLETLILLAPSFEGNLEGSAAERGSSNSSLSIRLTPFEMILMHKTRPQLLSNEIDGRYKDLKWF